MSGSGIKSAGTKKAVPQKKAGKAEAKSGLRNLKPGEVLFNDGDSANSLYIIQKGQLRLFKPKGKGFIEIAVLRAGEVIGEMAYFDEGGGGKRSCSASAMVSSDVIEISFTAFAKTMSGLNPWFKTIINTLANRLRATNSRVKELESNSASLNYSTGKHSGYEFLKPNDIIKILGTLFLVYKAHGESGANGVSLHRKTLDLYSKDIYGVIESKLDEMIIILQDLGLLSTINDKDGLPKILTLKSLDSIRSIFIFYNTEKHLTEEKKLKIAPKSQMILEKLWDKLRTSQASDETMVPVELGSILKAFSDKQLGVGVEQLAQPRNHGIVGEVIVGDGNEMTVEVNFHKLKKTLPSIQFMNRVAQSNESKEG